MVVSTAFQESKKSCETKTKYYFIFFGLLSEELLEYLVFKYQHGLKNNDALMPNMFTKRNKEKKLS